MQSLVSSLSFFSIRFTTSQSYVFSFALCLLYDFARCAPQLRPSTCVVVVDVIRCSIRFRVRPGEPTTRADAVDRRGAISGTQNPTTMRKALTQQQRAREKKQDDSAATRRTTILVSQLSLRPQSSSRPSKTTTDWFFQALAVCDRDNHRRHWPATTSSSSSNFRYISPRRNTE